MRWILTAAALVAVSASPALAQPPAFRDSLLDRLAGRWVLQGTIAEGQTTHDVTADWVLAHEYLRIHEVSREKDSTGAAAYEAIVFIGRDPRLGEYACLWLDSTGGGGLSAPVIGHAKRSGDEIPFVFTSQDGSAFHTTFAYDRSTDSWQWRMDAEQKGGLEPFARVRLVRRERPNHAGSRP
jgi:hypothetical protein